MPSFIKGKKNMKEIDITDELIENICKYVKSGAFIETAVIMAGIGKTTFYRWVKDSHKAELPKANGGVRKLNKRDKLKVKLRNAVARAIEESTMIDLANIQRCAIGKGPVFERYPEGTVITLQDDKGKVQLDKDKNPIEVDVSGHVMTDLKGKPIISVPGLAPDWKASQWRVERRNPSQWSPTITETTISKPLENDDENDSDVIEIIFTAPGGEKE